MQPVQGAKTLDPKGFEALVREHHRRLLAYALALTRRVDVSEDLVQDALLVTHRDLAKFDAARDFGAWVRGILRMKYLEWTRSHRLERLTEVQLDAIDARHREWDRAAEEDRVDALAALRLCREELGDHIGDTLDLFYAEHQSCADIAARLHVSEVVVRKRLQRARDVLGDCLQKRLGAAHGP
ncbi:MAG TPA: sigma-70 family RNA polymerase sigma factor [Planctomycetota bacterium]|nr:sigma-70 family RNA polymerase sigma factor [Planctomycetota bacterium]